MLQAGGGLPVHPTLPSSWLNIHVVLSGESENQRKEDTLQYSHQISLLDSSVEDVMEGY